MNDQSIQFLRELLPNVAFDDFPRTASRLDLNPHDYAQLKYIAREHVKSGEGPLAVTHLFGLELAVDDALPEGQVHVRDVTGELLGILVLGH